MTTICRHIKINGARCGSPALRNQTFCYFHRTLAERHPLPAAPDPSPAIIHPANPGRELQVAPPSTGLDLPPLEDRESIQVAVSLIIGALARNTIDSARASTLLYGLQVASANAVRLDFKPSLSYIVTETTHAPSGQEIAPDEDPEGELAYQEFLSSFENRADDDEEDDDDDRRPADFRASLSRMLRGA